MADFHEYPKWKYAKGEMGVLVADKDEEDALEGEYFNTPAEAELGVSAEDVFGSADDGDTTSDAPRRGPPRKNP